MQTTFENMTQAPESWVSLSSLGYSSYEISSRGRIRSYKHCDGSGMPFIMSPAPSGGYLTTTLTDDGGARKTVFIHRIACTVFNGPKPSPDMCATHINDVKANNSAENLRWASRSQNWHDSVANGTRQLGKTPRAWGRNAKLTVSTVRALRRKYATGVKVFKLAEEFGIPYYRAYSCVSGRTYANVGDTTAESEQIRRAAQADLDARKTAVRATQDAATIVALQAAAAPAGQIRRVSKHSPVKSPTSKGA